MPKYPDHLSYAPYGSDFLPEQYGILNGIFTVLGLDESGLRNRGIRPDQADSWSITIARGQVPPPYTTLEEFWLMLRQL